MSEFNCDSYCGLYCGACDIMVAYRTGKKSKFAKFWSKENLKEFLGVLDYPYSESDLELKCHGCKSDTVFINCRPCTIRKCAVEKNLEHCMDCSEYPCSIHLEYKKGEKVLPHSTDKQGNLESIRMLGADKWLDEQQKRWKCPDCEREFSWYATRCENCGKDLRSQTFRFSWLNSFFLKLGLQQAKSKKGKVT